METMGTAVVIAAFAYRIGSIPSAHIVGRLVAGVDMRVAGEGNVGARNAYHVVGHGWGVAVCLIDAAKGGAVAVALRDRPGWQLMLGGVAVIAGHGFPIWLGFVGGKGVATASGFGIALFLPAAVLGGASAGAVFAVTRRFLPTLVVAIVGTLAAAMLLGFVRDDRFARFLRYSSATAATALVMAAVFSANRMVPGIPSYVPPVYIATLIAIQSGYCWRFRALFFQLPVLACVKRQPTARTPSLSLNKGEKSSSMFDTSCVARCHVRPAASG